MKNYAGISTLFFILILLASCAQETLVCTTPYIQNGNSCCLDKDNDSSCDQAIMQNSLDCSLCPPRFVVEKEDVIKHKYVCYNESVVDKPEECGLKIISNAKLFNPGKEQDASYVTTFSADAACRGEAKAAEMHLTLVQNPQSITFQVMREPDGFYEDLGTIKVAADVYYYIGFCTSCQTLVDASLIPDRAYMIRAVMQYGDRKVYTRDIVIDPTPQGQIGKKSCGSTQVTV